VRNRWLKLIASCAVVVALYAATAGADSALDSALSDFQLVPMGGENPPGFSLDTLDGKKLSPGDLKGRAVLLYFWATW
jgi:cytochrome oxidase Cu insertion factor (SCO1/SenC/PrrC family)